MFHFSEIHPWQGEQAVQQILVFPSELLKNEFERDFPERVAKDGDKASDNNLGAVYKLRAVKNSDGKWCPVIRCGSSGEELSPNSLTTLLVHDTPQAALNTAAQKLLSTIQDSFPKLTSYLENIE